MALVTMFFKSALQSKSGNPCAKLMAPCALAMADITEKIEGPIWGNLLFKLPSKFTITNVTYLSGVLKTLCFQKTIS